MTRVLNAVLALTGALCVVSSTTIITRGQSSETVRYPTMVDMTFPEFEAAVKKTDIVLLNRWAVLFNGIRQQSVFRGDSFRAFIDGRYDHHYEPETQAAHQADGENRRETVRKRQC